MGQDGMLLSVFGSKDNHFAVMFEKRKSFRIRHKNLNETHHTQNASFFSLKY